MILNEFSMAIQSPSDYEERGHTPRPARSTIPPPTKK